MSVDTETKVYIESRLPAGASALAGGIALQVMGSTVIGTGRKGGYLSMPYGGRITGWTLLADQVGSVVVDVWKRSLATFPPTVADTITGGLKPTLSAQQMNTGVPTNWVATFAAGDVFTFNVDSASTVMQLTLLLQVVRS